MSQKSQRPTRRSRSARTSHPEGSGYNPEAGIPRYLTDRPAQGGGTVLNGAMLGAGIAILPSYFAAEASLAAFAHPIHWFGAVGATVLGATAGAFTGWLRGRRPGN